MSTKLSFYEDVTDTKGNESPLSDTMRDIQNGRWKKRIEWLRNIKSEADRKKFKNSLPCFTGAGLFRERNEKGLLEHSGRIIIDFDKLQNIEEIRQKLINDPYTEYLFSSCSATGLALVVRIDGNRHRGSFEFLEKYYKEKYALKIDTACKDVSRLRFVSYDPNLYVNEKSQSVTFPDAMKEEQITTTNLPGAGNERNKETMQAIINSGKLLGNDTYESWLKIGFALGQEFGEAGRVYFHELSKISPKYDPVDCDKKFDNCIRTNKGDVTFGTIVHLAKEVGIELVKNTSEWTPITVVTVVTDTPEEKIEIVNFPVEVFPVGLKEMVLSISNSMGVPVSVTGSIVLTIMGTAVGNAIRVSPKTTFEVSPFLWACVVMPTGSGKSPLLELLTRPIKSRQAAAYKRHKNELKQYQLSLRSFKKNETDELPDEPVLEQYLINDSTVEALTTAFEAQPRGLLSIQDELAAWLLGMNQYKGNGNDRQAYLQLFNSGDWSINRKSGVKFIPSTGLGIIGNIQPETIPLIFSKESLDDGLIQRLLFVYPGTQPMKFNRNTVDNLYLWDDILGWCYKLPIATDDNGFVIPKILRIEGEALDTYEAFYNEYGALATILPARYRGFVSKLFLYCLKFAGILHVVQGYGSDLGGTITETTVADAIKLTKFYFGQISLILKLYERNAKTFGESQNRLIHTLYSLRGNVDKGMLLLETIVDKFNEGLPANFQLTSEKIASILRNELGLTTQKAAGNYSYLIWENEKIKKLFKTTVTTVTTVTEKAEKRDGVTEVTEVTDGSENIPEIEFIEEVVHV